MTQLRFNVKLAQYPRDADYPHVNVARIHEIKIDHYTSAFISARVCKPKSTPIERRNLKPCAFLCYINLRRCFNKRATPDFSLSLKSDKKPSYFAFIFTVTSYLTSLVRESTTNTLGGRTPQTVPGIEERFRKLDTCISFPTETQTSWDQFFLVNSELGFLDCSFETKRFQWDCSFRFHRSYY